ncbi:helix-turn-helix transcriptional regulator [Reticulibacter mediterranei]|uniref:Helix-turn-helix transcriptional regulator n=1 Tax=Reticulibacter mediterranei TaxID=2778369 RepID=A0A8J3IU74_9CHLR|nr:LuxR C-terminal-related transcriptional regulator [Reticulibacter mediterranei]GHO97954.1 helix-turn-helix transcriptional regulator [Reticulibacter mediterranei]
MQLQDTTTFILTSRLRVPRLPIQHIPRLRLLALLEQSAQRALTLVSAPAGSGKTTLLAEWSNATTLPVAWLSLETTENDPMRFLSYLLAALARLDQHIGGTVRMEQYPQNYEQALTALLNDIDSLLHVDVALILDDYHLITSDAIHAALHFLLDHLPPRLHLIIGTRVDPPLPLARLRAYNQLSEIRAQELRFVADEVEAFTHAMGFSLPQEVTNLLEQRTEGWIAGIQLLTLALRGHNDPLPFLHAFRGDHHFFLDYVREEILSQQSPDMLRFLLHTSILERLTGPLCDAVTGQADGHARLAALVQANLFVWTLDESGTWYRYHPLFAESLRAHLLNQEPELLPTLYQRAASWYEQRGWIEEACDYALLGGDQIHAVRLLKQLLPGSITEGKFHSLNKWLAQLSPEVIASSPELCVASTWTTCCYTSSPEETIAFMQEQIEEHGEDDATDWADLQRELELSQAWLALARNDIARTISLAQETLRSLPSPARPLDTMVAVRLKVTLSTAYYASGDLPAAERLLLDATRETGRFRSLNLFAAGKLAELYEMQGQLRKTGRLFRDMFQVLGQQNNQSPLLHGLLQTRRAALLYEWNRLEEAETMAQQAMEAGQSLRLPIPLFAMLNLWVLGRIALARSEDERVSTLLEQAQRALTSWPDPEQMPMIQGAIPAYGIPARLALLAGRLDLTTCTWEETREIHFDDPLKPPLSSWNYFDYVTLARLLLARGRSHAPSLIQAQTLLDRLREVCADYNGWLLEIQILSALVLQAQGKIRQALNTLGSHLELAETEGYARLLADEGQPMRHLLTQIAPYTAASSAYLQKLLDALRAPVEMPPTLQREEQADRTTTLTARELEVLHLLADGASNQQIAHQLVISLHTVKLHVKHIFNRLGVTNRTGAVARGRELGLI